MKRFCLVLLLGALALSLGAESANPFTSSGPAPTLRPDEAPGSASLAIATALTPLLRGLTDRLAALTRALRDARGPGPLLALLLAAFIYGIFHALGPGHGKTMVSGLFLAKEARLRDTIVAGYLIALVHAVSALSIVMILFFIIRGIFSADFESASRFIRLASFGLITILGAVMLVRKILGKGHHHHGHHHHGQDQAHEAAQEGGVERLTTRQIWGVAVASGIVPCPGASAVILLSLSLNMIGVSILAVSAISLGMGLTVSIIGALAILAKRGVIRVAGAGSTSQDGHGASTVRRILEILGASLLFLFGLLFFVAQF